MNSMEVRVSDVKKWVGREESVRFVESWPHLAEARVDYSLSNPATVDALVRNAGGGSFIVEVKGVVEAQAICSRCAEPFHVSLPFEATEEFREELGPRDESLDYWRFTGDKINVDEMVADAVGVSFPISLVCKEDCRGLCSMCGQNLNLGECGCTPVVDDRWAALRDFKESTHDHHQQRLGREQHGRTKE